MFVFGHYVKFMDFTCLRDKINSFSTGVVEHNQNNMMEEIIDNQRDISAMTEEMNQINNRINLGATAGAYDPISIFKCRGTFVGHLGPVWCLCASGDFLFSGSTDKTIKVSLIE